MPILLIVILIPQSREKDLAKTGRSHNLDRVTSTSIERLNSLVSRLARGYLAAAPSMSLVPLAPFLACARNDSLTNARIYVRPCMLIVLAADNRLCSRT